MSPTRTPRAALAVCPFERILARSHAFFAKVRVLKNRAAHSHASILTPSMVLFSYESGAQDPCMRSNSPFGCPAQETHSQRPDPTRSFEPCKYPPKSWWTHV